MTEFLTALTLEIRCLSCGQRYEVSVASILESQQMLNEGCASRGESECPPMYLASLLDQEDLRQLQSLLARLEAQAAAQGAILRVAGQGS